MQSVHALVFSQGDDAVTAAVVDALGQDGWTTVVAREQQALAEANGPFQGVVYVPGLLTGGSQTADPAAALVDLVEALRPRLPSSEDGGARVVAVGSRDWLGWPTRPRMAAQAAGLIAAVRSLALAHGRAGITVNAVIGLPPVDDGPRPLTGEPVGAEDSAATVAFFLDPRSAYITGQTLHCCGGASLLSSMSV
jgi:hypothetical protein